MFRRFLFIMLLLLLDFSEISYRCFGLFTDDFAVVCSYLFCCNFNIYSPTVILLEIFCLFNCTYVSKFQFIYFLFISKQSNLIHSNSFTYMFRYVLRKLTGLCLLVMLHANFRGIYFTKLKVNFNFVVLLIYAFIHDYYFIFQILFSIKTIVC